MNTTITYQIEFFSYWHAGSGLTGSTYADSIVNKDKNGLPFIPGKTIKGLLREAAESIHQLNPNIVSESFITEVFGVRKDTMGDQANYKDEGKAFFSNIGMSRKLSELIESNDLTGELFTVISSTKIDENGQAEDGSLRQVEVTVPLTLYGKIEQFPGTQFEKELQYSMGWIKQLGQNRNRGLGKCKISIIKNVE